MVLLGRVLLIVWLVLVRVLLVVVSLFVGLCWFECYGAERAAVMCSCWCLTVQHELDAAALVLIVLFVVFIILLLFICCARACFALCFFGLHLAFDRCGWCLSTEQRNCTHSQDKRELMVMCAAHFASQPQHEYCADLLAAKKPSSSSASSLTGLGGESEEDMLRGGEETVSRTLAALQCLSLCECE